MAKLYNLARMITATTGTGTITLGSAVSGFLTFALAGVSNAEVVSYGIRDGANSEVGTGTYTSAGTTLTRTVSKSTNADAAISLSGSAQVYITATKADIANLREANIFTDGTASSSTTTGALVVTGGIGCGEDVYAVRGNFTNPAGNGGEQALKCSTVQTTVNTGENGDSLAAFSYTLTSSSTSDQLISRRFLMDATNNLTGAGSEITTLRIINVRSFANASATTATVAHLCVEGSNSGTVTNSIGLDISQLQGTNLYGIRDQVAGSIWLKGTTAGIVDCTANNPMMQLHGTTTATSNWAAYCWNNSTGPVATLSFNKSHGGSVGSHTVVTNGSSAGLLIFGGDDGTNFQIAGRIDMEISGGTPSSTSMPGRFRFSTSPAGTIVPTEKLNISDTDVIVRSATATPAGGSTSARLLFGTTAGFGIYYGSGAPSVSAASGSIYIRTDNAGASLRLYSNTTGSTTWAAITSA